MALGSVHPWTLHFEQELQVVILYKLTCQFDPPDMDRCGGIVHVD